MASVTLALRPARTPGNPEPNEEPKSPATLLDLPNELIIAICEAVMVVPHPESSGCWLLQNPKVVAIKDLMNLAQTCKAFRKAARPILYRHFDVAWLWSLESPKKPGPDSWYSKHQDTGETDLDVAKFFRLLAAMKRTRSADLVRYVDMAAFTAEYSLGHWNVLNAGNGRTTWDFPIEPLLAELNVRLGEVDHVKHDVPSEGFTETSGTSVLVFIAMFLFRNAFAMRLPIDNCTARLLEPSSPHFYMEDHENGYWDEKADELSMQRRFFECSGPVNLPNTPAFPHLTDLELVTQTDRISETLRPLENAHLKYITTNAPKLRTLRLYRFTDVNLTPSLYLSKITSLVLRNCPLSYSEIRKLALACKRLRSFKISGADCNHYEDRPIMWTGEEFFEGTYPILREDEMLDAPDSWVGRLREPFDQFPWATDQVRSSLVLQALEPVAETLETILLGQCLRVLVDTLDKDKQLNHKRREFYLSKFKSLRSLGIWVENLFPFIIAPNVNKLSDIVRDAPDMATLSIFSRDGTIEPDEEESALEQSLRKLSLDIEARKFMTYLKTIRICHIYEEEHGTTRVIKIPSDDNQSVWSLLSSNYDEDSDTTGIDQSPDVKPKASKYWGIKPRKIDPEVVERFARCGVKLVRLRGPENMIPGDGFDKPSTFPNPREADNFLWERY